MEQRGFTPVGTPSRCVAAASSSPYPLPSPSPFALSIASTAAASTKPPVLHISDLILRSLALLLSLVVVLMLSLTASPTGNGGHRGSRCPSFTRSSSYWYSHLPFVIRTRPSPYFPLSLSSQFLLAISYCQSDSTSYVFLDFSPLLEQPF